MTKQTIKDLLPIVNSALIIIGFTLVTMFLIRSFDSRYIHKHNRECGYDYYHELELEYWECKSQLVSEVQGYIDFHAPDSDLSAITVVNGCEEYDIDVKFVLVQGLQESHFGTKGLARRTNSVWNVKAYDGLTYDEIGDDGKYQHPDRSVRPYLDLLSRRYLVGKTEEQLLDEFIDVDGNRYASYEFYEKELKVKYAELNNTRLDSLTRSLRKHKLALNR